MTTAVILQIIVGIGGLLTLWARDYFSTGSVAERKEKVENAAIQKGRTDSQTGNADGVVVDLAGVLDDEAAASGGDAGSKGSVLESGSDDTVQRLANFGIRNE